MLNLIPVSILLFIILWFYQRHVFFHQAKRQARILGFASKLTQFFSLVQQHKRQIDQLIKENGDVNSECRATQNEIQGLLDDVICSSHTVEELYTSHINLKKIQPIWKQTCLRLEGELSMDTNHFLHGQIARQLHRIIMDLPNNSLIYWTEPGKQVRLTLQHLPSLAYYLTQLQDAVSNIQGVSRLPSSTHEQISFIIKKIRAKLALIERDSKLLKRFGSDSLRITDECNQDLIMTESILRKVFTTREKTEAEQLEGSEVRNLDRHLSEMLHSIQVLIQKNIAILHTQSKRERHESIQPQVIS